MLNFLIASDRATIRTQFKNLCASSGVHVCAEAVTPECALLLTKRHIPDVVVLNFRCSVARQAEAISEISRLFKKTKILVITSRESARSTRAYLVAGASALLPTLCTYQDLLSIVSGAGAGFNIVTIRSLPAPRVKLAYRAVVPVGDEGCPDG